METLKKIMAMVPAIAIAIAFLFFQPARSPVHRDKRRRHPLLLAMATGFICWNCSLLMFPLSAHFKHAGP